MKRQMVLRVLLLVCSVVTLFSVGNTAYAQSPSPFVGTPQSTPLCIHSGIPFVWVRTAPSSFAGTLMTLYPRDYAKLTIGVQAKDAVQWWVRANITISARRFVQGWIEADSLSACEQTFVPTGAPPPPNWEHTALCLKTGVPFVWERIAPSSFAPVASTRSAGSCNVGSMPALTSWNIYRWDGAQWWVLVGHPPREWSSKNWIEVNSLQPAS